MKVSRNDPCPCGSGKKYKQCCMTKSLPHATGKKKFAAKWLNPNIPQPANYSDLMERTFGNVQVPEAAKFEPVTDDGERAEEEQEQPPQL